MGYTHYWRSTRNEEIPQPAWDAIRKDTRALLAALPQRSTSAGGYHADDPLQISWEDDKPRKAPEVSAELIRFNGKRDLGHETFFFERTPASFAFCKTARKPYDLVVCGVLMVIAKHASEYVTITSDGEPADWKPALEWVQAVLGDGYSIPIKRR